MAESGVPEHGQCGGLEASEEAKQKQLRQLLVEVLHFSMQLKASGT